MEYVSNHYKVIITEVYKISLQVSERADLLPRSVYVLNKDPEHHNEQKSRNCAPTISLVYM